MKATTKFFTILILLLVLVSAGFAQTDTVSVIFVTDTHSHLVPFGQRNESGIGTIGGIARVATIVKNLMATEKNPLFVHSGDLFVNDIMFNKFFGVPEFKILIDLGLRVMCIGNHEFDLTPDRLKATLTEIGVTASKLEIVTANVDMSKDPDLASIVKSFTIVPISKVKIGIFGLTPPMTNSFSNPSPDSITNFREAAELAVAELRPQCDLVIGLTHLNVADDDTLAATIPDIDLIIGGHSHTHNLEPRWIANARGVTPILRAGCYYQWVGLARLAISPSGMEILHHELIVIDDTIAEDAEVAAKVDSLVAEVNIDPRYGPIYSEIIAESENFMAHSAGYGFKDSPVGNLVTDAMRSATGTQIALDVDGWIAQPIFASPLSGADIFQAVPYGYDAESGYGYKIVTFSLTGYLLKSALEYAIHESLSDGSFNVQVSNMEIKYDSRKPLGQKISLMKIGGQPYALFSGYSITMSDGLARFLYLAGLSMVNPQPTGLVEYEVVKDYVVAHSPLNYVAEGRIQDTFETSVATNQIDQVPVQFTLLQNYPNPFNPETTILFQLGQADRVSVRIFNTVGQLVKTLVDGHKSRGTYTIKWNSKDETGTDVASGVYFYQLKTKDAVEQKKMLLIR